MRLFSYELSSDIKTYYLISYCVLKLTFKLFGPFARFAKYTLHYLFHCVHTGTEKFGSSTIKIYQRI